MERYFGTVQDGSIVPDEPLGLPDGTRVRFEPSADSTTRPEARAPRGSAEALLRALQSMPEDVAMTEEEGRAFDELLKEMRRIEPEMWGPGSFEE